MTVGAPDATGFVKLEQGWSMLDQQWRTTREHGGVAFPSGELVRRHPSDRSGYVVEPWHARWVGQPLASRLEVAGYQDWADLDADDVTTITRRINGGLNGFAERKAALARAKLVLGR